jgi:hypothetical protein
MSLQIIPHGAVQLRSYLAFVQGSVPLATARSHAAQGPQRKAMRLSRGTPGTPRLVPTYAACELPRAGGPSTLYKLPAQAPARHASSNARRSTKPRAPPPAAAANPTQQLLNDIQRAASFKALHGALRSARVRVEAVHTVAALVQLSAVKARQTGSHRYSGRPLLRYIAELATPLVPQYQFQDISTSLHALRQVRSWRACQKNR